MSANAAHFDDNQVPTSMGAIGTLGTADTGGTAKAIPFSADGTTGAAHVYLITKLDSTNDSVTIGGGTLGLVTTVSNVTNGSINILTGTIQNSGTTTGVGVVSNVTNGSINVLTGTVTSITNLAGGTIQINPKASIPGSTTVSVGTTGVAVWGTLVAPAGAGTLQYVSGLAVVVASGTVDVAVTNIGIGGSAGAGVLARGQFTPGGGMVREFSPVQVSAANGTISYWLGGAGTVALQASYWQAT